MSTIMYNITSLPDEILLEINTYLNDRDKNKLYFCNKFLYELKLIHYNFKTRYSLKYCRDIDFQTKINSRIRYKKYQLNLDFYACEKITNADILKINTAHVLDLSSTEISNVSSLTNVHTLHLHHCKKITDVSALNMVHTLDLTSTRVTDVSALGNVHTLN